MSTTFQTISPIDGSVYVERSYANDKQINNTLEKAKAARREWRNTPLSIRKMICERAVQYFLDHSMELGVELTWQMGRPIRYTPAEITRGFQERARYMISIAEQTLADIPTEKVAGYHRFIRKDPLGTVLVLAPWNYPYLTSVNVIIPALLAGNTVILKHATQTPLCAERYAKAFQEAGLPEGVLQYLHITHEQVAKLIEHPTIDYVAFTGSVKGGEAIQTAVNKRFIAAGLELGGKDPAYVRADANIEHSIENLVDGAFFNSGQSCCGVERIYVQESLFDEFVEGFVELTKQYVLGNPTINEVTLGPMVKTSAAKYAQQQIAEAIRKGAKTLIDPNLFDAHNPESPYMAPQVLVDVNHEMDVMREESFAPIVGIMPVKNDEEAIQLMNDSPYGLTASIWSEYIEAAIQIGDQLETGTCFLNRCDYLDPALAWTGVKDSGRGCTLSALGFDALTRPKSFHLKLV